MLSLDFLKMNPHSLSTYCVLYTKLVTCTSISYVNISGLVNPDMITWKTYKEALGGHICFHSTKNYSLHFP